MSKRTAKQPRHYPTTESGLARYQTDWRRGWLLLGQQMDSGDADLAGDTAWALLATAPDLSVLL